MFKKILIAIIVLLVIVGSFIGGWFAKTRSYDSHYAGMRVPASNLIESIISGDNIDKQYESMSRIYTDAFTLDQLKQTVVPLKDSVISKDSAYIGDTDIIASYELVRPDKSYDVVISSTKEDNGWKVSSLSISEKAQQ